MSGGNKMKIRFLILALSLFIFGAATAVAAPPASTLTPKISSFDFLLDDSGSMMMTHQKLGKNKMEMAKGAMLRINDEIPALPYDGSIHTFAPYAEVQSLSAWDKAAFGKKIEAMRSDKEVFGRMTPMGSGFNEVSDSYKKMRRPSAALLFSDGDSNRGPEPVAEARALLAANPGLCIHVVSFAETPAGQATLNAIAALNNCSKVVFGPELITDNSVLEKFVADVFYSVKPPAAPSAPTPPPVPVESAIVLNTIQFAFDSAVLDNDATSLLTEVANKINAAPGKVVTVAGHTCNTGDKGYNQGLSERRARSVRDFLVQRGVPAGRLQAVGYGEARPKYDNSKADGRRMNRRVELGFE